MCLFSDKSQKVSKCGKNISDIAYYLMACVPLFCSYHFLMSSVISYWTDTQQDGIYFVKMAITFCILKMDIYSICVNHFIKHVVFFLSLHSAEYEINSPTNMRQHGRMVRVPDLKSALLKTGTERNIPGYTGTRRNDARMKQNGQE